MTSTDPQVLRNLMQLARLSLTEAEQATLVQDLQRILSAFEVLAEVRPVAPEAAAESARALATWTMRADQAVASLEGEALLASATRHDEGFFVVPKTVGGEA